MKKLGEKLIELMKSHDFQTFDVMFWLLKQQMMTQKSVIRSANQFQLRGIGPETQVGDIAFNYEEMAKSHEIAKTVIPTFNQDGLYFTPAFFLPTDQKYYTQNSTFQRFQFKEKIERNLEFTNQHTSHKLIDSLKLTAPNSNYCQICCQKYNSYFAHITQEEHLRIVKKNPINQCISDLCRTFKNSKKKQVTAPKTKGIKKGLRSQRQQSLMGNIISKNDAINDGSEYYPKNLSQSTTVRGKEDLSRVN